MERPVRRRCGRTTTEFDVLLAYAITAGAGRPEDFPNPHKPHRESAQKLDCASPFGRANVAPSLYLSSNQSSASPVNQFWCSPSLSNVIVGTPGEWPSATGCDLLRPSIG
jgi:hypothetical protein